MEKATLRTLCIVLFLASTSVFSQGETDFTGQVLYHYGYPLSGVNAYLHNSAGNVVDTAVTNSTGFYEFADVTPGTYTITFSTQQPEGGIELNDAYLVMLKLMNLYTFTPIQTLAADVNNSGTITWSDYFMILISYLNQGNPFPHPWVFQSITTAIPNESRSIFTTGGGSSSGDVNGSLQPDPKSNPIYIESPFKDITKSPANPLEFSLTCAENTVISGMHLVFDIPEGLEITNVKSAIPSANIYNSGNRLSVTWIDQNRNGVEISNGTPLVMINAQVNRISRNDQSFGIYLKDQSHVIDGEGNIIQGLKLSMPVLNVHFIDQITCSAYPNPFSTSATIEFSQPEDGQIIISLFDQAGRQVQEIANTYFQAGQHQVKVDGTRLFPGIYHYSVRMEGSDQNFVVGTIIKSK